MDDEAITGSLSLVPSCRFSPDHKANSNTEEHHSTSNEKQSQSADTHADLMSVLDEDTIAINEALAASTNETHSAVFGGLDSVSFLPENCVVLNDAPDVKPSLHHTVMFHVSGALRGACPKPHGSGRDLWDTEHVRLPCSPQSLYPAFTNGERLLSASDHGLPSNRLSSRWALICDALHRPFSCAADFERAILAYNSRMRGRWEFGLWRHFVEHVMSESEAEHLLSHTLPLVARLALKLPNLVRKPLPLLRQNCNHSVSLTQQQIACLLANAFFCTFPRRNTIRYSRQHKQEQSQSAPSLPAINMNRLFSGGVSERRIEKLKCLLHYFHRVLKEMPAGCVTFTRRHVAPTAAPDWPACHDRRLSRIWSRADGLIEREPASHLHVDFANCMVGGGVLGEGCVQEEIAFVQRPELITACLLTERLSEGEALLVTGAEVFSATGGYADTFTWCGKEVDDQPRDRFGRRCWRMVAIDAADYSAVYGDLWQQFRPAEIRCQLLKAFSGFSVDPRWCTTPTACVLGAGVASLPPVVTGNWGCGAFGGDRRLKAVIQLVAASAAGRDLSYLTFGDHVLCQQLNQLQLIAAGVSVARLFNLLLEFSSAAGTTECHTDVLQFIIDRLSQQNKAGLEHEMGTRYFSGVPHHRDASIDNPTGTQLEKVEISVVKSEIRENGVENSCHSALYNSAEQQKTDGSKNSTKAEDANEPDHVSESEDSASEMSQSQPKRLRSTDIRSYFKRSA